MITTCGCEPTKLPTIYSTTPGEPGYDRKVATTCVAVFIDGAYHGEATAYDVGAGWAVVDGERIEGKIVPGWL